jgi:hypothetical protein
MRACIAWNPPDDARRALNAALAPHRLRGPALAFTPRLTVAGAPRRATAHSGVEDASAVRLTHPQRYVRIELMRSVQERPGARCQALRVAELKGI